MRCVNTDNADSETTLATLCPASSYRMSGVRGSRVTAFRQLAND